MWLRIRPRCAISLGKSIVVAYSNSQSPCEYEFATDTSHNLRSQYKKIAKPKQWMSRIIPIALVRRDGVYVIETRGVGECP